MIGSGTNPDLEKMQEVSAWGVNKWFNTMVSCGYFHGMSIPTIEKYSIHSYTVAWYPHYCDPYLDDANDAPDN